MTSQRLWKRLSNILLFLYGVALTLFCGSILISKWIYGDLILARGGFHFEWIEWIGEITGILLVLAGLCFALSPLNRKLLGILSLCLTCVVASLTIYSSLFVEPPRNWFVGLLLGLAFGLVLLFVPSLYLLLSLRRDTVAIDRAGAVLLALAVIVLLVAGLGGISLRF